jgi:hypothetical protein
VVERLQVPAMGSIWKQITYRPLYVSLKFNVLDYGIQFKRGELIVAHPTLQALALPSIVERATHSTHADALYDTP